MFCISFFFALDQIPKIKICHIVASEHPEVIEERQRLISMEIIEYQGAHEDISTDDDDYALDGE